MSDQQGWTAPGAPSPTQRPDGSPPAGANHYPPQGIAYPPPGLDDLPRAPLPQAAGPVGPPGPPPQGWVPPQPAPKPGIIPLRPLTLGEIWSGVMTAIRGNPAATIGLALVTTAVVLVPLTVVGVWVAQNVAGSASIGPFDPAGTVGDDFSAAFEGQMAGSIPQLASYVTAFLLPLFMAVVIGQGVQGQRIGIGATARAARGRIWPAIGVLLLAGLATVLVLGVLIAVVVMAWVATGDGDSSGAGLVTFVAVVVGIWLAVLFSVRWCFAVTIVVLESAGPVTALRRSWALTRKRGFWRIFGIRLLTAIVVGIAGSVIAVPLGLLSGAISGGAVTDALWLVPVLQAGTVLVQSVLTTPFSSGVDSLLYVDQRIRHEGLDLVLLQQSVQGHDTSGS